MKPHFLTFVLEARQEKREGVKGKKVMRKKSKREGKKTLPLVVLYNHKEVLSFER